ncbi:YciI family protein [Sphingomonas sp. dw_22]|uniref:YciI family protein n=1 Tax=Sphingomonas sp. dw_22 TaxID=2721175 RepID=UPI001BD49ED4|nr:YciI family protein [Sphingomonas sp. dw_22]
MIVVSLHYKVDAATIDAARPAHIDWLKQGLADGKLLAAGRKVPTTGGLLIARGTIEDVRAWCASDPFAVQGLADYDFTEVAPSLFAPGLEPLGQ